MPIPSAYDDFFFPLSREFIEENVNKHLNLVKEDAIVLDIGSQGKDLGRTFPKGSIIRTLDIDETANPDYLADICENNSSIISDESFDAVILTDVLEHVCQPFFAVDEVIRILKPNGLIVFSSPLNCRIHGPVPDCWRFTEFGLQVLFRNLDCIAFEKFESPDRNLFPLQYFGVWKKPEVKRELKVQDLKFKRIE